MFYHRKECSCNKGHENCICGYPQPKPPQQLPSQTLPVQQEPVKQMEEHVSQDIYVPVSHPSHTTQINHVNYKYMHSYPHTKSIVNSVSHEHYCVCPPNQGYNFCKPKRFC